MDIQLDKLRRERDKNEEFSLLWSLIAYRENIHISGSAAWIPFFSGTSELDISLFKNLNVHTNN
jgi:hypothetical protein